MELTIDTAQQINAARLDSEISVRVAKKSLDAQKVEGEAAIALLKAAADTASSTSGSPLPGRVDLLA